VAKRPFPAAIQRWQYLRAIAHFEGAWTSCRRAACHARQQCTGGPRGTCERVGLPLCRLHVGGWEDEVMPRAAPLMIEGRR